MKQILFVCNLFAPANHISAVRPTKIAKYLGQYDDVNISVIAHSDSLKGVADQILKDDISDTDVGVEYCKNGSISKIIEFVLEKYNILKKAKENKTHYQPIVNTSFDANSSRNTGFRKTVFYLLTRMLEWDRAKSLIKVVKRRKQQYDVVITFGPNCSDYVGRFLKRKNGNRVIWIADFRDPFKTDTTPKLFQKYADNYAKRIISSADCIVAVTPGYLKSLNCNEEQKKAVITNGFDESDIKGITVSPQLNKKFCLVCVGALYAGQRKLDPVFKAVKELYEEQKIQIEDIEIDYAGGSESELKSVATHFSLEEIVISRGVVTRKESLEMQFGSSALLLPSWNYFKGQDILPGKFFEFLMTKKPIIAIISGKQNNSYLRTLIERYNLGVVYEEGDEETTFFVLKDYILRLYLTWKKNGNTQGIISSNDVEEFAYKNIAKQYYGLIFDQLSYDL